MSLSIGYYIVLFVLKIKRVKKVFSNDPIEYLKIRKDDVLNPSNRYLRKNINRKFKVSDTEITEIAKSVKSDTLVIYIHGGAFVCGPAQHHWDTVAEISKKTKNVIWMCVYPKAPETNITDINTNIDQVYAQALTEYKAQNIVLLGDSAGGTLILTLTQRLISNQFTIPKKIILISPVIDASLQNPDIEKVEPLDPMLGINGVRSAKKLAAGQLSLIDSAISPIYGTFNGFPPTILFAAEYDITYPDQIRLAKLLNENNIENQLIIGEKMPHIWPLLPVMREGRAALDEIIEALIA